MSRQRSQARYIVKKKIVIVIAMTNVQKALDDSNPGLKIIKLFFMLNSTEHEISTGFEN